MRTILSFLIFLGLATPAIAASVPESARSRAAIERVRDDLSQSLDRAGFTLGAPVFIRIFKREAVLEVWMQDGPAYRLFRTYRICRWSGDLGPKLKQGDRQSPEGFYFVRPSQMNPHSSYHLSFNLGYPNAYDRSHGRTGSFLMVHGDCASVGCYAMATGWFPFGHKRNRPIEEIWTMMDAAYRAGQPFIRVHAFPFRMAPENMSKHADSRWHGFWQNLQEGYDWFEKRKRPPDVFVENRKYRFRQD